MVLAGLDEPRRSLPGRALSRKNDKPMRRPPLGGVVEIHHRSMPGPVTERSPIPASSPRRSGDTPKQLALPNLCLRMVITMSDRNDVRRRPTRNDRGESQPPRPATVSDNADVPYGREIRSAPDSKPGALR
jgi:hypothetical protein